MVVIEACQETLNQRINKEETSIRWMPHLACIPVNMQGRIGWGRRNTEIGCIEIGYHRIGSKKWRWTGNRGLKKLYIAIGAWMIDTQCKIQVLPYSTRLPWNATRRDLCEVKWNLQMQSMEGDFQLQFDVAPKSLVTLWIPIGSITTVLANSCWIRVPLLCLARGVGRNSTVRYGMIH